MKLLLCKNVEKLGIVGDIVDVRPGYGRNFLLPQGIATEPTTGNVRRLAEARKIAEADLIRERKQLEAYTEKLNGAEVTLRARANDDGVLYGSVGAREIALALVEEGHPIVAKHIKLDDPIRHLDNVEVEVSLGEGLSSTIKVWVVREKTEDDEDEDSENEAFGREADRNDDAGE